MNITLSNITRKLESALYLLPTRQMLVVLEKSESYQTLSGSPRDPRRVFLTLVDVDTPEQLAGCVEADRWVFVVENYAALPDEHRQILELYSDLGALVVI